MSTTTPISQKRTDKILEHLDYSAKTARRVTWEAYEFTITAPGRVTVTNASYGYLRDDHTYTVTIEKVDGVALPAECDCPGYEHHYGPNGEADKHMVALATIGGSTILNAALNASSCLDGLAGCDGPNGEAFPCFTCYTVQEKAEGR